MIDSKLATDVEVLVGRCRLGRLGCRRALRQAG
jgi:hypothetical protein